MKDDHCASMIWRLLGKLACLKSWAIFALLTSKTIVNTQDLIMVTSTIPTDRAVCPGVVAIFLCVTRQSAVITWTSDTYIGDQIGFDFASNINETRRGSVDTNTIAILLNNTDENGVPVLVSQLRIIISTVSSNPTVTCVHGSNGIPFPSTFQVIADPGRPRVTAHLTGDVMRGCTLHISWIIPVSTNISDITNYAIFIDGVNIHNETNTNDETFLSLSYLVRSCAPHNTSVSIVNHCDRAGPPSPTISIVSPEPLICDDMVCEDCTITDSASTCMETTFKVLFALAFVVMVPSVGLNVFLIIYIIKNIKRTNMRVIPCFQ